MSQAHSTAMHQPGSSVDRNASTTLVRPIVREDLPLIQSVIDDNGPLFPPPLTRRDDCTLSRRLQAPTSLWLTINAQSVAYCAPEPMASGTWNVLLIALTPAQHGQGWGSQLMRHIERVLNEQLVDSQAVCSA